jgi:apolipoprotein N-acyltransferase
MLLAPKSIKLTCLYSFIAGALLVLGFSPFNLWIMGFVSAALFLNLYHNRSAKHASLIGFCFGLGLFGCGASWIFVSIDTYGNTNAFVATLITGLFIVILALFPALQAGLAKRFFKVPFCIEALVVFPSLWTAAELIRGSLFTGFPWLLLGYTQTFTFLSGYAKCFSVFGLSWIVAFLSGLILLLIHLMQQKKLATALVTALMIMLTLIGGAILHHQKFVKAVPGPELKVALVQGDIPQIIKWSPQALQQITLIYSKLTGPVLNTPLIVWPENAIPDFPENIMPFINAIDNTTASLKSAIVFGLPIDNPVNHQYYNGALALGDADGMYLKQHLVPFGEYVPLGLQSFYNFMNIPMSNFTAGPSSVIPMQIHGLPVSIFICYESAYPMELREAAHSDYIITLSDDSWFGHSLGPYQHQQIDAMRAIETGRPILRATNSGVTSMIDSQGHILVAAPLFIPTVLMGAITPVTGMTPWLEWGIWPVIIFIVTLLIAAWMLSIFLRGRKYEIKQTA